MAKKRLKSHIHRDLDLQLHRDFVSKVMISKFFSMLNPEGRAYFLPLAEEFVTKRKYVLKQMEEYNLQ